MMYAMGFGLFIQVSKLAGLSIPSQDTNRITLALLS
jgi:hypothetical protein